MNLSLKFLFLYNIRHRIRLPLECMLHLIKEEEPKKTHHLASIIFWIDILMLSLILCIMVSEQTFNAVYLTTMIFLIIHFTSLNRFYEGVKKSAIGRMFSTAMLMFSILTSLFFLFYLDI